jgi:hypothetical protein
MSQWCMLQTLLPGRRLQCGIAPPSMLRCRMLGHPGREGGIGAGIESVDGDRHSVSICS